MSLSITLRRTVSDPTATCGEISLDGVFFCYSLERPAVQIPAGTYTVEMTESPHFKRAMPLVDGVPGRSTIRLHPGNEASDSDGCILVGYSQTEAFISQSRKASDDLNQRIIEAGEAELTII